MNKNQNNRKTFTITYTSEESGETFEGTFTTKRLAVRDRSKIGMRKSQLAGGMYCVRDDEGNPTGQGLDEDTDYLNGMIAHLEVCLIQKPSWFDLDNLTDLDLVREVYEKVFDFEASFFRDRNEDGRPEESGSNGVGDQNGSQQPPGAGAGHAPTQVVDQQVQAALDA